MATFGRIVCFSLIATYVKCQGGYGSGGAEARQPGRGETVGNIQASQYQPGRGETVGNIQTFQYQQERGGRVGGGEVSGNLQTSGGAGPYQQSGRLELGQGRPPGGYGTLPPPTVYPVPPLPREQYQPGAGQTSNIEVPQLPRQPQYGVGQTSNVEQPGRSGSENFQNQQINPGSYQQQQQAIQVQKPPGSENEQRYRPPEFNRGGGGEAGFHPDSESGRRPSFESVQERKETGSLERAHGGQGFEGASNRQAPTEGYTSARSAALSGEGGGGGGMQPSVNPESFQSQSHGGQMPTVQAAQQYDDKGKAGGNVAEQKLAGFEKSFHGDGADLFNDQPQSDIKNKAKSKSPISDVDGENEKECTVKPSDSQQKCVWKFQEKHHLNLWPSSMFASICESLAKNVDACKQMCESESECRSIHFCRNCVGHNCRLMSEKENGKAGLKLIQEFEFVDYYEKIAC